METTDGQRLDLPERDPLPHFVRGFIALAQGEFEPALAHYRTGLACESCNPALAADIRQLAAEIERLAAQRESSAGPLSDPAFVFTGCTRHLH